MNQTITLHDLITIFSAFGGILSTIIIVGYYLLMKKFEKIDSKFDKIDDRFDKIDDRFGKMDDRFDKMDQKFERQIIELRQEMAKGFSELRQDIRFLTYDRSNWIPQVISKDLTKPILKEENK